jgi:hypothetical protein
MRAVLGRGKQPFVRAVGMSKFVLVLSSGTTVYTDEAGRELVLGSKKQGEGPFLSINGYAGPTSEHASMQVEVNRQEVAMISPAKDAGS